MKIIIGTRASQLALWQANWVKGRLTARGHVVEIKIIKTAGDKLANAPLTDSGTKGLFIKEIEEALLDGSIDVAVHSMKDLPTEQPSGLVVAAVPEREDARDVFVSRDGTAFDSLAAGARVGTSSLRRQCQLKALRRDIEVVPLRGNLDTRLKKLDRGDCDGVVVAAAGLRRLGLAKRIAGVFNPDEMCPAVGQGALAIEIRQDDKRIEGVVRSLDHEVSHQAVRAERATLRRLGGGCQVPVAAHAVANGSAMRLVALVASLDGGEIIRAEGVGAASDPERLGTSAAEELLKRGARAILEENQRAKVKS
jgi:hydroxymethylbilane synthase